MGYNGIQADRDSPADYFLLDKHQSVKQKHHFKGSKHHLKETGKHGKQEGELASRMTIKNVLPMMHIERNKEMEPKNRDGDKIDVSSNTNNESSVVDIYGNINNDSKSGFETLKAFTEDDLTTDEGDPTEEISTETPPTTIPPSDSTHTITPTTPPPTPTVTPTTTPISTPTPPGCSEGLSAGKLLSHLCPPLTNINITIQSVPM